MSALQKTYEEVLRSALNGWRFRLFKWRTYVLKGDSLFSVVKYVFLIPGLESYEKLVMSLCGYFLICWTLGRAMYQKGPDGLSLVEIEAEMGNRYNALSKQLRERLIKG